MYKAIQLSKYLSKKETFLSYLLLVLLTLGFMATIMLPTVGGRGVALLISGGIIIYQNLLFRKVQAMITRDEIEGERFDNDTSKE